MKTRERYVQFYDDDELLTLHGDSWSLNLSMSRRVQVFLRKWRRYHEK